MNVNKLSLSRNIRAEDLKNKIVYKNVQLPIADFYQLSNDERTNLVEFQDAIDAFLTKFQKETKNSSQKILVGLSDIVEKFNLDNRFELVFDNKFIVSISKELKVEFQTDKQLASSKKTSNKSL